MLALSCVAPENGVFGFMDIIPELSLRVESGMTGPSLYYVIQRYVSGQGKEKSG